MCHERGLEQFQNRAIYLTQAAPGGCGQRFGAFEFLQRRMLQEMHRAGAKAH